MRTKVSHRSIRVGSRELQPNRSRQLRHRVGALEVDASELKGLVSWEFVLLNSRLVP